MRAFAGMVSSPRDSSRGSKRGRSPRNITRDDLEIALGDLRAKLRQDMAKEFRRIHLETFQYFQPSDNAQPSVEEEEEEEDRFPGSPIAERCDSKDAFAPPGKEFTVDTVSSYPYSCESTEVEEAVIPFLRSHESSSGRRTYTRKTLRGTRRLSRSDEEEESIWSQSTWRDFVQTLVKSTRFDFCCSLAVVANALMVGVQTEYMATHSNDITTDLIMFEMANAIFCLLFSCELLLRIYASGFGFCEIGPDFGWNLYDTVLVLCQIFDVLTSILPGADLHSQSNLLKLLRMLRLVRILRVIRVVRFIVELRSMISSILGSMKSLFWAMLLILLLIYVVGVGFTQMALEFRDSMQEENPAMGRSLEKYFGSLRTAIICLYEAISGGLDWDNMLQPLLVGSPLLACAFVMYIVFVQLAMMNVITGVFVEQALSKAQEDKDIYVSKHVTDLFKNSDLLNENGEISFDTFEMQLHSDELVELFNAVNVDPSEALGLFRLLDVDNNGTLDPEELMSGWQRLSGHAKSLDLSLLMAEQSKMNEWSYNTFRGIQKQLTWIVEHLKDSKGQARLVAGAVARTLSAQQMFQADECQPFDKAVSDALSRPLKRPLQLLDS